MRVVLFGKAFGEHGLGDVINNLQRDPNIGRDVQLALVDGSSEELLKHVRTNGSLYLSELLEQNIKTETIPRTALNIFYITSIHLDVIHFFLTFKYQKTNLLLLKGSLFKKDKVAMYTDRKRSFYLNYSLIQRKMGVTKFRYVKVNIKE